MIVGKGYVSTEAIMVLCGHNINVILLDNYGNLVTNMCKTMSSNTATKYRMGQYDTFRNPAKVLFLQKQLLVAKLESQNHFLQLLNKEQLIGCIDGLAAYAQKVQHCNNKRELLRIEAAAGQVYFRYYVSLFDPKYGFESRRGGGIKMSNRYASDIINALLNYGYSVLAGEIAKIVHGLGLDPYYGFYHNADVSFQALVYDLIEPHRWIIEYAVYRMVTKTSHNRPIAKRDYGWTNEGRIILDNSLIRRFLEILERIFQRERSHEFKHGLKRSNGMSMCQEITIVKITISTLAEMCRSNSGENLDHSMELERLLT